MPQTKSELELVWLRESLQTRLHATATPEEPRTFGEFHSIQEDAIRSAIRRFHCPPEIVDDLTQAVWAKVIVGVERRHLDPALGTLTAWIVKIANDVAKDHARKQARRTQEPLTPETASALADPEPGPDIEFESMQNVADLRKLIEEFAASLKRKEDRRLARLRWLEELSLSKIAADMMISEDSASGLLRRVGLKLADYLRQRGYSATRRKKERLSRILRR